MEPTPRPVIYVFRAPIVNIEHRFQRLHVSGGGDTAVFKTVSQGWYIHLEGSWEALGVGDEEPPYKVGDVLTIKIGQFDET